RGFVHNPATDALGGVLARGPIVRDATINLVALRRIEAKEKVAELRRYILGLALVAATDTGDGFYRQGCLLTLNPAKPSEWFKVTRDGERKAIGLTDTLAKTFAEDAAKKFGVGDNKSVAFDKVLAKADLSEAGKNNANKRQK